MTEPKADPAQQVDGDPASENQKRLDFLTKKNSNQEQQIAALLAGNQSRDTQIATLMEKINTLESAAGRPDAGGDPFDAVLKGATSSGKPKQPAGEDIASLIRAEIGAALKPIVERDAQREKQDKLARVQEQVFDHACTLIPELADDKSNAKTAFNQIMAANQELFELESGPLWAAIAAGWTSQGARKVEKDLDTAKQAAKINRPGLGTPKTITPTQKEELKQVTQELAAKAEGGWSLQDESDYFHAKIAEAVSQQSE